LKAVSGPPDVDSVCDEGCAEVAVQTLSVGTISRIAPAHYGARYIFVWDGDGGERRRAFALARTTKNSGVGWPARADEISSEPREILIRTLAHLARVGGERVHLGGA